MVIPERKPQIILSIILVTVFLGQIYIAPFGTAFRLSLAVISLSFLLVFFKEVNVMVCCTAVGFLMFGFRGAIAFINDPAIPFSTLIVQYLPVVTYYFFYGLFFLVLGIREKNREPIPFILSLWICDALPNIIEATVRKEWTQSPFEQLILAIIIMGSLRSVVTYVMVRLADTYLNHFEISRKEQYFRELVLFTARLKTELFFLRKSREDIERAMRKSHEAYQMISDPALRPVMLSVAKEIHEVKKDYSRVIAGMEATLGQELPDNPMQLSDLFKILLENNQRLIDSQNKRIMLSCSHGGDVSIRHFYSLISVLNNLIINAIEAIDDYGSITFTHEKVETGHLFTVRDNGPGISDDNREVVFHPGYSTKYNPVSGIMSTGIGLTHARQIVEEVFHSTLELSSVPDLRTEFRFCIPHGALGPDADHNITED